MAFNPLFIETEVILRDGTHMKVNFQSSFHRDDKTSTVIFFLDNSLSILFSSRQNHGFQLTGFGVRIFQSSFHRDSVLTSLVPSASRKSFNPLFIETINIIVTVVDDDNFQSSFHRDDILEVARRIDEIILSILFSSRLYSIKELENVADSSFNPLFIETIAYTTIDGVLSTAFNPLFIETKHK